MEDDHGKAPDFAEKGEKIRVDNHWPSVIEACEAKGYQPCFTQEEYAGIRARHQFRCLAHGYTFFSCVLNVGSVSHQCQKCRLIGASKGEQEITDYVRSICSGPVVQGERSILGEHREIDVYLPELKVGIEYHGLYWHSELQKERKYHHEKYQAACEQGIQLLQFYEDEWRDVRDICKSMIAHKLGFNTIKYHARKLVVKEYQSKDRAGREKIDEFLNKNHLQGTSRFMRAFTLEDADEQIILAVTFRKPFTKKKQGIVEIARLASKQLTTVRGGFSKLLKPAIAWAKENGFYAILTYSDCRYSQGQTYIRTGFSPKGHTGLNYFYTDFNVRHGRFKFRAQPGLTELEVAVANDVYKLYGPGHLAWWMEISPENRQKIVDVQQHTGEENA